MKLWTAEQTARRAVVMIGAVGLLTTGIGVHSCILSARVGERDLWGMYYALINSMFLVQAVGLAVYLRLRGRKGVLVLRTCCAVSAAVAVIGGLLSRDVFGGLVWLVASMPVVTALLFHALVMRRIERGDDSPLMPGAEYLAGTTWKRVLIIYLVCGILVFLLFAVLGRIPGPRARREPSAAPREPLEGDSMRDFANLDWDEEHGF